jgi:hypothetical protein
MCEALYHGGRIEFNYTVGPSVFFSFLLLELLIAFSVVLVRRLVWV